MAECCNTEHNWVWPRYTALLLQYISHCWWLRQEANPFSPSRGRGTLMYQAKVRFHLLMKMIIAWFEVSSYHVFKYYIYTIWTTFGESYDLNSLRFNKTAGVSPMERVYYKQNVLTYSDLTKLTTKTVGAWALLGPCQLKSCTIDNTIQKTTVYNTLYTSHSIDLYETESEGQV